MSQSNDSKKRAQAADRQARYRERMKEKGMKQLVILAPDALHPAIKLAAQKIIDEAKP